MLNRELLSQVAVGQKQRNISDVSIKGYLYRMHVITRKLDEIEDIRLTALEMDADGIPLKHSNAAHNICKLKLPIEVEAAQLLFAALSIDGSLTRKTRAQANVPEVQADIIEQQQVTDYRNIAANISTVTAQTYQNYKSALKWWHEYDSVEFDKVGSPFPAEVDKAINCCIGTYKRDVASKRRRGVMKHKDGKSKYNLQGYGKSSE